MYSVKVNEKIEHQVAWDGEKARINDQELVPAITRIDDTRFHIRLGDRSVEAEILLHDAVAKTYTIRINGNKYQVSVKDDLDLLLAKLGMDAMSVAKVNDVKAPMPGLVLKMLVNEGDTVKKGDGLLVLEAMKMENIIKSPGEGTVKKIAVSLRDAVEKNQVLIFMA